MSKNRVLHFRVSSELQDTIRNLAVNRGVKESQAIRDLLTAGLIISEERENLIDEVASQKVLTREQLEEVPTNMLVTFRETFAEHGHEVDDVAIAKKRGLEPFPVPDVFDRGDK